MTWQADTDEEARALRDRVLGRVCQLPGAEAEAHLGQLLGEVLARAPIDWYTHGTAWAQALGLRAAPTTTRTRCGRAS